jgi:hypothetical protein
MQDNIPPDIFRKIEELFTDAEDQEAVLTIVRELFDRHWGVGREQLARSLLVLSEGKLTALQEAMNGMEPRDIIRSAEAKAGNPGHYFIPTFDQMTS